MQIVMEIADPLAIVHKHIDAARGIQQFTK